MSVPRPSSHRGEGRRRRMIRATGPKIYLRDGAHRAAPTPPRIVAPGEHIGHGPSLRRMRHLAPAVSLVPAPPGDQARRRSCHVAICPEGGGVFPCLPWGKRPHQSRENVAKDVAKCADSWGHGRTITEIFPTIAEEMEGYGRWRKPRVQFVNSRSRVRVQQPTPYRIAAEQGGELNSGYRHSQARSHPSSYPETVLPVSTARAMPHAGSPRREDGRRGPPDKHDTGRRRGSQLRRREPDIIPGVSSEAPTICHADESRVALQKAPLTAICGYRYWVWLEIPRVEADS